MRAVLLACLLAGCAAPQGVEMSAEDVAACAEQTCSVWTKQELILLMKRAWKDGYQHGKDSI